MKQFLLLLISISSAFAQVSYPKIETTKRFTGEERQLIHSGDTTKMLRVTQVTKTTDLSILTAVSEDIDFNDPSLPLLAKRMYLSVTDPSTNGVGIAAPQVGINRNLIWVQRFDKAGTPFEFYINPKITWRSDLLQLGPEGCLSIPNQRDNVVRSYAIQLTYTNLQGATQTEIIEGFTAVIFQHETDHLLGILFPQRVSDQNSQEFLGSEKKGKKLLYHKNNSKRL